MQNYITMKDLRKKLGNRSRSAIYNDLKNGDLPQPIILGKTQIWGVDDLEEFLAELALKACKSDVCDGDKIHPRWSDNLMERNKSIISMRRSGITLDKIAKQHGISSQRVRQIILMHNKANEVDAV